MVKVRYGKTTNPSSGQAATEKPLYLSENSMILCHLRVKTLILFTVIALVTKRPRMPFFFIIFNVSGIFKFKIKIKNTKNTVSPSPQLQKVVIFFFPIRNSLVRCYWPLQKNWPIMTAPFLDVIGWRWSKKTP